MTILLSALVLSATFGLTYVANSICRHGVAGFADLIATRLMSFAEAWRHGTALYKKAIRVNGQWAAERKIAG